MFLQSGVASRAMASAAKDEKYDFDLFTIGGGTGGVRAARFASTDYGMSSFILQLQPPPYLMHSTRISLSQPDSNKVAYALHMRADGA